jgi:hypothetical protein
MSTTNQDIAKAIQSLVPNAAFSVSNEDITTLVWNDEREQPTQESIQAALAIVIAAKPLAALREERNRRITETDWWVLPDRTPTAEQLAYRQALRDITSTYSSLDDAVWPLKPE